MLNQAITIENLIRLLRRNEPKKFKMGRNREDYLKHLNNGLSSINPKEHNFASIKKGRVNGKTIIMVTDLIETLILRKCDDNIKRIFNLRTNNRQDIIKKTHIMLSEPIPYFIYRLDISSFYESVDKVKVLEKVNDSSIISYATKKIVENFFNSNIFSDQAGLPRGIGLSSTLSNLYLECLDNTLNKKSSVYYHSRCVDDIIIFTFEKIPEFLDYFQSILPEPLNLNKDKCKEFHIDNIKKSEHVLDFLGYTFVIPNNHHKKTREVKIKLADSKVNKIKKRIALSLKDYVKSGDHALLDKRIKYLTGNIPVVNLQEDNNTLHSGIYYTFMHLTEHEQLKSLDNFKNNLIFSPKGELARKLRNHPSDNYRKIKKHSFYFGHKNKVKHKFSFKEVKEITRIW